MSAQRTVTLTCDIPGCREQWCDDTSSGWVHRTRDDAARLGGWSSYQAADGRRFDVCGFHS